MEQKHDQYRVKVCGMRDYTNIQSLAMLEPDYMGFIFYPGSKRYVGDYPDQKIFADVPARVKKAGVFVNADPVMIMEKIKIFDLQAVQLHGDESVDTCITLRDMGVEVIKSIPVEDHLPVDLMKGYENAVDYFLLDTKTPQYGGSGRKFEWHILKDYGLQKPVFLSGGIGPDDVEELRALNLPFIHVLDINSRFETKPGLKDIDRVQQFVMAIRTK